MSAPGHSKHTSVPSKKSKRTMELAAHAIPRADITTPYIDTHCHLLTTLSMLQEKTHDTSIPPGRVDLLAKALFPENCKAVVDIHCDIPVMEVPQLSEWPEGFRYYFAAGAHPHVAVAYTDEVHAQLVALMSDPRCVAWGECGLDFNKNPPATHGPQRSAFIQQLLAAVAASKPLVIHTRDADDDTRGVLDTHMPRDHPFHVHCFTSSSFFGSWVLREFPNACLGITGVVTYNLPHVQEMIRSGALPLERMLLETDSPFMVPRNVYPWIKANRSKEEGKKRFEACHSGMLVFTAEMVAGWINEGAVARGEEKRVGVEEVLEVTRRNAERMYGIEL
ncbi:hydrolase [Geopyxis carbonaria]|nr:hydrolase [Geopyxis carbonaria]